MAMKRKSATEEKKNSAKAFVNWSIETPNGTLSSSRGFPVFDNPDYPNPEEMLLVEATKENGGYLELTMKVRVCLNRSGESRKVSASDLLGKKKAAPVRRRASKTAAGAVV